MPQISDVKGMLMIKKSKGIGNFIINVLCSMIILTVFSIVILFLLGVRPYIVLSGSMEPAVHVGSLCFVNTRAAYEDIREEDIIVYETANGTMVAHRAISVSDIGIETKGDANKVSDGITTTQGNFRGKTIFSIPGIGYAIEFLKSR